MMTCADANGGSRIGLLLTTRRTTDYECEVGTYMTQARRRVRLSSGGARSTYMTHSMRPCSSCTGYSGQRRASLEMGRKCFGN